MSKLILEVEGKKYPLTNSTFNSYNRGAGPGVSHRQYVYHSDKNNKIG